MINDSIHQEEALILNLCIPCKFASYEARLTEFKEKLVKSIIIVDFNTFGSH